MCRYDDRAMVIMDPDREWVFSADPLGRISWIHTPEVTYRRSHFNQWYRLKREHWNELNRIDRSAIEASIHSWLPAWKRAHKKSTGTLKHRLQHWIDHFVDFHRKEGDRFRSIYQHIPILPPDAYQTLYVQLSRGCPWNQCSFCNFYRDTAYRVHNADELTKHIQAVRSYWEGALGGRNGLFLGDANAIAIPMEKLVKRVRMVRTMFHEESFQGLSSFSDFFSSPQRAQHDFARLRNEGLRRVCFGVESGHMELLDQLQKPVGPSDVEKVIQNAKAGDIQVSLIFIVGLGGHRYREAHFQSSMELLSNLPLERADRIYLSPLVVEPSAEYDEIAEEHHWDFLTNQEVDREMSRWKEAAGKLHPSLPASLYNIRLFTY